MPHLNLPGKDLNIDIGKLVDRGLNPQIQQMLDVLRVTGNSAVHPGQIDVDSPDVAESLFRLLNLIVELLIAIPEQVRDQYAQLPQGALDSIQKRDAKP